MIKILSTLLGGSSLAAWAVVATIVAASIGGFGWYEHHAGYASAATEYQAKIDSLVADYKSKSADELERQTAVNDAAKAAEARDIVSMQAANEQLQKQMEEQSNAADQDPDADAPALGADSVRRINAIH